MTRAATTRRGIWVIAALAACAGTVGCTMEYRANIRTTNAGQAIDVDCWNRGDAPLLLVWHQSYGYAIDNSGPYVRCIRVIASDKPGRFIVPDEPFTTTNTASTNPWFRHGTKSWPAFACSWSSAGKFGVVCPLDEDNPQGLAIGWTAREFLNRQTAPYGRMLRCDEDGDLRMRWLLHKINSPDRDFASDLVDRTTCAAIAAFVLAHPDAFSEETRTIALAVPHEAAALPK